jgi:hypothetical protein
MYCQFLTATEHYGLRNTGVTLPPIGLRISPEVVLTLNNRLRAMLLTNPIVVDMVPI